MAAWTHRETITEWAEVISFDSPAAAAGIYTTSGAWPNTCNTVNWAVVFALIAAGSPAFVQSNGNGTPTHTNTLASWDVPFTGPNAAGNCLLAFCVYEPSSDVGGAVTATDLQGNTWTQIYNFHLPFQSRHAAALIAPNCAAGVNTLTLRCGAGITIGEITVVIHEYSGISTATPTGVTNPDMGGQSPVPTGCLDAIQTLANGPDSNSYTGNITTLQPNDMLILFPATDPACPGFIVGALIPPGAGGGGEFHGTFTGFIAAGQIGGGTK